MFERFDVENKKIITRSYENTQRSWIISFFWQEKDNETQSFINKPLCNIYTRASVSLAKPDWWRRKESDFLFWIADSVRHRSILSKKCEILESEA